MQTKTKNNIQTINELATLATTNVNAKEELWEKLKPLTLAEAKRCCLSFHKALGLDWNEFFEDLVQDLYIVFEICLRTWKPERKDFLGFAKFNFHFRLIVAIRDNYVKNWRVTNKRLEHENKFPTQEEEGRPFIDLVFYEDLISEIESDQVSKLYFIEGLTQQEIAQKLGTNQTYICKQVKQIKTKYQDLFGFYLDD